MKPLLTFLFLLIISKSFAQEYDLDSLVKTHKKVALLPVKVRYNHENLKDGVTLESVINREYSDGFLIQNSFYDYLENEKKLLKVDIQPINETNRFLAENTITLKDLEELSPDMIANALHVDGIMEIEINRKSYIAQIGNNGTNTDAAIDAAAKGFLTGNPLYLVLAVASIQDPNKESVSSTTTITCKMVISDGKTGEIIRKYTNGLVDGPLNSTYKVIEKVFWTNFKKSPYYRK
jgi:hypothetical protein